MLGEIREWIYESFAGELESPFLIVEQLTDGSYETIDASGRKSLFYGDFILARSRQIDHDKN